MRFLPASWRRAADVVRQTQGPATELADLRDTVAGCPSPDCPTHWQEWRDIGVLTALLIDRAG